MKRVHFNRELFPLEPIFSTGKLKKDFNQKWTIPKKALIPASEQF